MLGPLVPENEPAWLVLMDLKDIVPLVVAPVHTDESISYLESKIVEHRQRYQDLFPGVRLVLKRHYLEHYPPEYVSGAERREFPLPAYVGVRSFAPSLHHSIAQNYTRQLCSKTTFCSLKISFSSGEIALRLLKFKRGSNS